MKSGMKITADNAASLLAGIEKLSKMDVLVGIPESKAAREDGETLNNAEIGYLQSTGATVKLGGVEVTLPPRPFLDMGIEDTQAASTAHMRAAATLALDGDFAGAGKQLESAGLVASEGAKRIIGDGDRLQPLSEATIAMRRRKKINGDIPLYAKGYLLDSITYVVRGK